MEFAPNVLYIWAGSTGQPDAYTCTLQTLLLGGEDELLAEDLPELVTGVGLHALVLNMMSEGIPVNELQALVPHVIRWKPGALRHSSCRPPKVRAAQFCASAPSLHAAQPAGRQVADSHRSAYCDVYQLHSR